MNLKNVQIVVPIYNDWDSILRLLPAIDEQLGLVGVVADILLIDDGSYVPHPNGWPCTLGNIQAVRVLRLQRNLGHQRAICVGLCFLCSESTAETIIVMDGDGEDSPNDIPRLLSAFKKNSSIRVVFAERTKRSEGIPFRLSYTAYRFLHRVLVGHRIRVGNFSVIDRTCLESLCASSELWNHYAAAIYATKQPVALVPTRRGVRLAGDSKMNFPSLVMHGLSALAVFSERISTRMLIFSALAMGMAIIGMTAVTLIRLTTGYAIPGWATNAFGLFALLLVQIVAFVFTFCFVILFTRGLGHFIPIRDSKYFIKRVEVVWSHRGA